MRVELPTEAEAEKIRAGEREIINRYYMANLEYIQRCAWNFCRRAWRSCEVPDLVQEIYIVFEKLDFDNAAYFGHSLYKAFSLYKWGGVRKYGQAKSAHAVEVLYILDNPVKGLEKEGETIGECVPVPEREEKPDISRSYTPFCRNIWHRSKSGFFPVSIGRAARIMKWRPILTKTPGR